ncbi:MAG TPA: hypothetical protein VG168_05670 [Bryobacteraceae bacterium]|nr:hypothetical protein [Bryobacteraceae bacterium]
MSTRRNLLQSALLAPVTGLGATVLLVTALNWAAPVRIVGPIATALMLALSAWLIRRRRMPVPFRRLAPFAAVVLLAALAVGYPMFRFGFNWVSYCNDDMANYCLSAKFLLNHNQFAPPSIQDILSHKDASLFFWYFDVLTPIRHGTDEVLAWALSLTGLASHQGFMPMILAFQLVLITSAGALVLQSRKYRGAALLVCFWLAFSALIALGSVYQLFGQVSGLAALAGAAAVLLRRPALQCRSELVLGGFLLASLSMIYPEVLPFLVIGYGVYHAISLVKGHERIRDIVRTIWPIAAFWLVFVNVSLPVPLLTLLRQSEAVMPTAAAAGIFPFYMTPAAFAYLWGFRAISEAPRGIGLDVAIVAGALLWGVALFGAGWHTWKGRPVAIVCLIMMALSLVLFRTRSEFGLYKIAMYLQPFLVGVIVLTWYELRDRAGRSGAFRVLLVAGLALVIGFGARGQLFYTIRSMGLGGGGLIEIPYASRNGLISQLKELPASSDVTISDTANVVLAKFESVYRGQLYFLCQDFFDGFLSVPEDRAAWLNPIYVHDHARSLKVLKAAREGQASEAFDMHSALPMPNRFTVRLPISGNGQFAIIEDSTQLSVLNRRTSGSGHARSIRLTSTHAEPNHLAFVASEFGRSYYDTGGASRSLVSMYQVEDDFFFRGGTMASLGRVALFRALHPSPRVRLVLEYTASLNHDKENRIPAASAIGDTREMFAAVGRGSARLISPPLQPQQIAGGDYIALDMGTWGRTFPDQRSFIMGLWGRDYVADTRHLVGFCRDISLISDDQYLAIQAPSVIQSFPGDLKNKSLEYSGIYEDGWVAESSYIVLQQDDGANHLVVSVVVPTLQGRSAATWVALSVGGNEVARKPVASGSVGFNVLIPGKGRRRIGLRFDNAVDLPSPDTRPVSAQLRYAGFQH